MLTFLHILCVLFFLRGDVDTFHEFAAEGWRVLTEHPTGRPGVVDLQPLDPGWHAAYKKIIAVGSGPVWT